MSFTRFIAETKYNKIGGVFGVLILIPCWTYFRILAYPYNLIDIMNNTKIFNEKNGKSNNLENIFFVLLWMVFILSSYWLFLILKSTINFLTKGIISDS
jgi:hypothetical protein